MLQPSHSLITKDWGSINVERNGEMFSVRLLSICTREREGERRGGRKTEFFPFTLLTFRLYFRFYTFSNFLLRFSHNKIKLKIMRIKSNVMDTFVLSRTLPSVTPLRSGSVECNVFSMCWKLPGVSLQLKIFLPKLFSTSSGFCRKFIATKVST